MPSIKGTQTEKNVCLAMLTAARAQGSYRAYAEAAHQEGWDALAGLFMAASHHHQEYARRWSKFLEGGRAELALELNLDPVGTTAVNLQGAAAAEEQRATAIYPGYAATAEEENLPAIAAVCRGVAAACAHRAGIFADLLEKLTQDTLFRRAESVRWQCRNCGYVAEGNEAPQVCPVCAHAQGSFALCQAPY